MERTPALRSLREIKTAQWLTTISPHLTTIQATFPDGAVDIRFCVKPVTFPGGSKGSGLFAARKFRKNEYLTVYNDSPSTERNTTNDASPVPGTTSWK